MFCLRCDSLLDRFVMLLGGVNNAGERTYLLLSLPFHNALSQAGMTKALNTQNPRHLEIFKRSPKQPLSQKENKKLNPSMFRE